MVFRESAALGALIFPKLAYCCRALQGYTASVTGVRPQNPLVSVWGDADDHRPLSPC